MSQSEDLKDMMADTLSRNNRTRLMSLPENERQAMIDQMTEDIETASDFEIMSYLSENIKEVSSDVAARLNQIDINIERMTPVLGEAGMATHSILTEKKNLQRKAGLQEAGVSLDDDLPAGSLEMGFGVNPVKAMKEALSEHFKTDVFVTEKDGELFYFNPKDRKMRLANPNILGAAGHSLPVIGDITGTIAAGLMGRRLNVGKQIGAEATGSFVGTTAGELTRLTLGRIMGVHDLTGNEMLIKAGATGAEAAAWTGAAGGLAATAKWMKNWQEGGIFTKQSAIDAGAGAEEAEIAVKEFNRLANGGKEFKGTTGKMSPDVNIQADEAAVRELKEYKQKFIDRDLENQSAISEKLDVVTKPKPKQEGVSGIKDVAKKDVMEKTTIADKELATVEENFNASMKELSSTSSKTVGRPTRETIDAMKAAENKAQVDTWTKMKEKHGFNEETQTFGIDIPKGEGATRLEKIFTRRAETATTVSAKRAASKIFVRDKKASKLQDLNDYNDQLSKISKDIRALESNPSAGQAAIRDLNETKAALKADRAEALISTGKEDLLKDITEAELKTAKYYEKYSEGVIGELTKKVNGVPKLKDSKFISRILEGTPEEADELIEIVGKSPKLMNMWKEGVADVYKSKVFTGKKFNQEAHDRFLQENREIMSKFIPDIQNIGKAGNLAIKLENQVAKHKETIAKINKDWSGKLQSMDSRDVVDFITTKKGGFTSSGEEIQHQVSKIKAIKNALKDYPSQWREIQEEYSTKIRNSVQDLKNKQVNNIALNKTLIEQKEELIEMMGKKYYDDLEKVNKVAEIAAKKLKKEPDTEASGVINALLRMSIAPPLSREGRGLTALKKWTKKSTHKIIADAFLDVKTISEVAKRSVHSRPAREMLEIAVSTGMIDIEEEQDGN